MPYRGTEHKIKHFKLNFSIVYLTVVYITVVYITVVYITVVYITVVYITVVYLYRSSLSFKEFFAANLNRP